MIGGRFQGSSSAKFDKSVTDFAAITAKPDAGIYRIAARRLGFEPATVVFIGDGGDRELEGAEQAGFRRSFLTMAVRRVTYAAPGPERLPQGICRLCLNRRT